MNPLVTVVNTAARVANWLMDTYVDPRICKWVEDTKGEDE
jgi:hypothetical protein